ncbi:N-acetylmuramoyl-L-alanine amidase [Spirosoma sordidisoli]|uniref:N-acetylmuramoyl-L-alanine amidase n=1 Tax=Spirosoma sordidisoli TaxID=2502893 RepID=A0A4Q2UK36_9BACT|nr:N-acetylmuramoyl-L-alanine amidase [Spirosoma sordidisoli]RYC69634.1 N-acetylmuramoyl-L-alanine amidase [Spirosoma sordidisoli]
MRQIDHIVLHCTAGPQSQTIDAIKNWWKTGLGWKQVGYHILIKADGEAVRLAEDEVVTNGVKNHNARSIHISYIGGVNKNGVAVDNRTPAQIATQLRLLREYKEKYPAARIVGHRDFLVPGKPGYKSCPSFSVRDFLTKHAPELL